MNGGHRGLYDALQQIVDILSEQPDLLAPSSGDTPHIDNDDTDEQGHLQEMRRTDSAGTDRHYTSVAEGVAAEDANSRHSETLDVHYNVCCQYPITALCT